MSQDPTTQPSNVKAEGGGDTNTINVKVRVYPSSREVTALSQVNDRSSRLQETKSSSRSNARRSSPSSRGHMRTRSGKMSTAFGAFSYVYSSWIIPNIPHASDRTLTDTTSFLYDGTRINDEDTPDSLDMDDNGVFFSFDSSFVHRVLIDTLQTLST